MIGKSYHAGIIHQLEIIIVGAAAGGAVAAAAAFALAKLHAGGKREREREIQSVEIGFARHDGFASLALSLLLYAHDPQLNSWRANKENFSPSFSLLPISVRLPGPLWPRSRSCVPAHARTSNKSSHSLIYAGVSTD